MKLRVIWQFMYGQVCHPENIIWTSASFRSINILGVTVHKLPFGPKCYELFAILYTTDQNYFNQNTIGCIVWTFQVLYFIGPGPVQYTIYWTCLLTKTNSVNKNVKYNIHTYIYLKRNVIKNILQFPLSNFSSFINNLY